MIIFKILVFGPSPALRVTTWINKKSPFGWLTKGTFRIVIKNYNLGLPYLVTGYDDTTTHHVHHCAVHHHIVCCYVHFNYLFLKFVLIKKPLRFAEV